MRTRKSMPALTALLLCLVLAACGVGPASVREESESLEKPVPESSREEKPVPVREESRPEISQKEEFYASPIAVMAADFDTHYSRVVAFLDLALTAEDVPEVAAYYREHLDDMDALCEKFGGFHRGLAIAAYDLNNDGCMDYIVGLEDTGSLGYSHVILLAGAGGGFPEFLSVLPGEVSRC